MTNKVMKRASIGALIGSLTSACSFVELNPSASHIILANDQASCKTIKTIEATVTTSNFFIDRSERAIAEDLQIKALNEAYENKANAIWPSSEVESGKQSFDLLRCEYK